MNGVYVDNTIRITVHNKERFGHGGKVSFGVFELRVFELLFELLPA